MRAPFFIAAAIHLALTVCLMAALEINVLILAAIGMIATLIIGGLAFYRRGSGPGMWAGAVAGLVALVGWGSWLMVWAEDPEGNQPVINIAGVLLPALAVVVYLLAGLLPSTRRPRTP